VKKPHRAGKLHTPARAQEEKPLSDKNQTMLRLGSRDNEPRAEHVRWSLRALDSRCGCAWCEARSWLAAPHYPQDFCLHTARLPPAAHHRRSTSPSPLFPGESSLRGKKAPLAASPVPAPPVGMLSELSAPWFAVRPLESRGTRAHGGWCAHHTAPAVFSMRHDGRYAGTRGSHDPPTLHRGTSPAVHTTRSVAPGFSTDGREHSTARTRAGAVSHRPRGSDGAGQPVQRPPPPASPAIQRPTTSWRCRGPNPTTIHQIGPCLPSDHVMIGMHALCVVGGSMHGRTRTGLQKMTLEVKRLHHRRRLAHAAPVRHHPTSCTCTHQQCVLPAGGNHLRSAHARVGLTNLVTPRQVG
jgi:hypothetical protein